MQQQFPSPRRVFTVVSLTATLLLGACNRGDVGAPCNHGRIEPPDSKVVTFPALSCTELLCVYADETEPSNDNCIVGQQGDEDCDSADRTQNRFECVPAGDDPTTGVCRLRIQYVLERSMCSKKCSEDSDCQDGGVGNKVVNDPTECQRGFRCARIQSLGEFCCEKLCVCEDDLGVTNDLDEACEDGSQAGCCDKDVKPPQCGPF